MLLPVGASSFAEAMEMGCETYHHLKSVIKKKYGQDVSDSIFIIFLLFISVNIFKAANVGDEGGFAPNIQNNREGVELLMSGIIMFFLSLQL